MEIKPWKPGTPEMESIMSQIKPHLKPTVKGGRGENIHHYNRAWEKIESWHKNLLEKAGKK